MASYAHRPAPTGLHAKMLAELSAAQGAYIVTPSPSGLPNAVRVSRLVKGYGVPVWSGHRDLMPAEYQGAFDPSHVLSRPASD